MLLLETMQDLLELKAAIAGIVREFDRGLRRVPIQAQPTLITEGRMLLGTDIRAVTATLDALPIDVIGLNCSTGPSQMRDSVRYLAENSRCSVSVIPNAGLPLMGPKGETIYPESPDELARELAEFVRDFGVNIVGGCCGSTPAHITAIMRSRSDGFGKVSRTAYHSMRVMRTCPARRRLRHDGRRARTKSRARCLSANASIAKVRVKSSACCSRTIR